MDSISLSWQSAVVADTGSALSHAAIVAREYNIPAVLGVGLQLPNSRWRYHTSRW